MSMNVKRKSKKFWAVDDDRVRRVTGWSCEPNKHVWWCPELGWSGTEEIHLFKTEMDALDAAIEGVEKALNRMQRALTDLRRQRSKMP